MKTTASKLSLLKKCRLIESLPWQYDPPGPAAKFGTDVHAWLEWKLGGGQEPKISQEARECSEKIDTVAMTEGVTAIGIEMAFGWDWVTEKVRVIGERIGRNYEKSETEICGTADFIGANNGSLIVRDYKTGKKVDRPKDNQQLMFLAMCANKRFSDNEIVCNPDFIHLEIIYIDKEGKYKIESDIIGVSQLEAFERQLVSVVEKTLIIRDTQEPERTQLFANLGFHCRFCPARNSCNKYRKKIGLKEVDYDRVKSDRRAVGKTRKSRLLTKLPKKLRKPTSPIEPQVAGDNRKKGGPQV